VIQAGSCAARAAVVLVALCVACTSPEERFAQHMESGAEHAEAGESEAAILEYRSALRIDPDSVEANEQLAEQLLRQADLSATYYLGEAIRIDPSRVDLAMRLARILLLTYRLDDAERVIEATLATHPDSSVVQSARAELLLYRNDPEAAYESAQRATTIDPKNPDAWYQLGRVLQGKMQMARLKKEKPERGIRGRAIKAFERADELSGGMVLARIERARLIGLRRKSYSEAKEAFENAVALAVEQEDDALQFIAAEATAQYARKARKYQLQLWATKQMVDADPDRIDVWLDLVNLVGLVDRSTNRGVEVFDSLFAVRPDNVEGHMAFVSYLVDHGEKRKALQHLHEIIDRDLGSPLPWEQLIRIQIQRGRIANARADYVQMSDEFPDDPVTRRTEARIALAEGRAEDAAEILRKLTADVDSVQHQRLLALAEYRSGNLDRAADAINTALARQPRASFEGFRLKARIHHDSEEWAATLRSLAIVERRGHPLTPAELLMRARAQYEFDQPEKGYETLVQILDSETPVNQAAIEFAHREGLAHPQMATAYLRKALERDPTDAELLESIVALDLRAGRVPQALGRINQVVQSGRARPETLMLRAQVLAQSGDYDRAEADALRAFEADPTLVGGVDLLYEIYAAQGRLEEARASFEEAEAAGVLHEGARLLLGRIYMRTGDTQKAREVFEKIIREDPNAATAKNDLAYLLASDGVELNRAVKLAQEATEAKSHDADAADTLGFVYLQKGLHEAALSQFEHALDLNGDRPGNLAPMLHYHLGLTLRALERNREAVAAFERALALDSEFPEAVDARKRLEEARRAPTGTANTS